MNFKVHLLPIGREIDADPLETVLDAALRQGVEYPHSCKNGRCGACKSRLKSGEVEHLSHLRFTLTESEKADRIFLACRAVPKTDLELGWITDAEDQKTFIADARVVEKSRLTHDTTRLVLEVARNEVRFQPGQFAVLRIPGLPPRSYSMANRPNGSQLEFFIREVPHGIVSTFIGSRLDQGASVQVEGPFGASYLKQQHYGPILTVAGGSGIAPMKSIIDSALHLGMKQPVHLYFGVREERDFYLLDHFASLARDFTNFHVHTVMDRASSVSIHRVARLDQAIFSDWNNFDGNWNAYIAGPPALVESLAAQLPAKGIPEEAIFADPFNFEST